MTSQISYTNDLTVPDKSAEARRKSANDGHQPALGDASGANAPRGLWGTALGPRCGAVNGFEVVIPGGIPVDVLVDRDAIGGSVS